jgi:hypothetical protein
MSDDTLTAAQRAVILLLMATATKVGNNELKERFGVTITGSGRTSLNKLKLVETGKVKGYGNQLFHELTEPGWARARQELTGELPKETWGRAIAYALAEQVHRYLDRADLRLYDIFVPAALADAEEGSPADDAPAAIIDTPGDLEGRIRAAYWSLATEPNAWIGLAELRGSLTDVPKGELDEALRLLGRAADVTITPESNKKSLTDADKAAAVRIGRQDKHLIAIDGA